MDGNEIVEFPDNLTELSDEDVKTLEQQARAEFDTLASNEEIDDDGVERLETLASGIEALSSERRTRVAAGKTEAAAAKTETAASKKRKLPKLAPEFTPAEEEEYAARTVVVASAEKPKPRVSLAAAQDRAPQIRVVENNLTITASAPIAGRAIGTQFDDLGQLTSAFNSHAKSLVTSHGNPGFLTVATIENNFSHVIDGERTTDSEFDAMLRDLRSADKVEEIVAAGGWCAPSEIRYDFFNIACQDGMIDLPTFGVNRGGIQYPVSPSLADVFTGSFTNATNPWLWTEADDILAATGAPTKPCVRVICPSFENVRLECYGICLTAGNLTDNAYPEATRNHLSLLMSAHYHAMNQRFIQRMVSLSTGAIAVPSGESILSDAPGAAAVAAQDYRTRFGMCDDDVLEVVFPRWVRDAMRDDHLRRNGFWTSPLTDAEIDALFTARRIRVQWVNDWQIRGSGQPGQAAGSALIGWPTSVNFMIYAAGTFIKGNGLSLDLGVVRDSVLNETNDHTASWTEECHLIARVGHESRLYTLPVCVAGRTGAANVTNCHLDA